VVSAAGNIPSFAMFSFYHAPVVRRFGEKRRR
jgi:hypothetical protein